MTSAWMMLRPEQHININITSICAARLVLLRWQSWPLACLDHVMLQ
jgi:hypothetical protein